MAQVLGTGKQRATKTSRVLVGTQALTFASWSATVRGEDIDTINFESYNIVQGHTYDEGILGMLGCDIAFGGDWDAGTNPLGSPPGLYPRDDLANLYFYTSRLDVIFWTFAYARLRGAVNSAADPSRGKVVFNCTGKNQGVFLWPTGSV